MAQVRFDEVNFSGNNSGNNFQVKFFSLKNDGDEAIVRIMHDSINDFDILTTHQISEDGKYRGRVSCLRTPREDISKCPLCAANAPVQQRMYIHLIQYVQDETGKIVPQAAVWERSVSYANQIKSYIDSYGPMSDVICKIVRHGRPGDQQTRYDIIPNLNKQVYRDDIYVKDMSLFGDYSALGNAVQERTFDELSTYVKTGHMPQRQAPVQNTIPTSTPTPSAPYVNPNIQTPTAGNPVYATPSNGVPYAPYTAPASNNYTYNNSPQTPGVTIQETALPRPNRTY